MMSVIFSDLIFAVGSKLDSVNQGDRRARCLSLLAPALK